MSLVVRRSLSVPHARKPAVVYPRAPKRAAWIAVLLLGLASHQIASAQGIPARLSDADFWKLVTDYSEPGGFFRSDNFVGNETSLQHMLPELARRVKPGGVYLGVAPDQNFTMLVALKPKIAFIVDIRRQNLIHHLMYKALMELSPTRADFLALLFSRAKPATADTLASVTALFERLNATPRSRAQFEQNFTGVLNHLVKTHSFKLSDQDTTTLRYVYEAFLTAGPTITYNFRSGDGGAGGGGGFRGMPTYSDMVSEADMVGTRRSYLATEANYRLIREMQLKNLLVPLVGDFAGPRALRAVGQYVRERGESITAFYTSNVEQYLFQAPDDWHRFYSNVATLPLDSTSTLIRSVPNNNAQFASTAGWPGPRSTMLLSYMTDIVSAFRGGRVVTYADVIGLAK